MKLYNRDRGSIIYGTKGSVVMDRDGYEVYDIKGKKTDEFLTGRQTSTSDLVGRDAMTDAHFANFINSARGLDTLHSPISIANISVTMLLISNIAWIRDREMKLNPANGHIVNDPEAMKLWGREYEKGWEVTV